MIGTRSPFQRFAVAALLGLAAIAVSAQEEEPPICPEGVRAPYVFILLDTSGSLNLSSECPQDQFDLGECPVLCPTGDCFVPLQGDDPASQIHLYKQGLQIALAEQLDDPVMGVNLGFASFNQDQLRVRAKHWIYEAQAGGPLLANGARYPAAGAREAFGFLWSCDTGSNDHEIGCLAAKPADLTDAWEVGRVQRLPKGGTNLNQNVTVYIRQVPFSYKVTYTPVGGGALGNPTINMTVRVDRCTTSACTGFSSTSQQVVTWSLVDEFVSWDNAVGPERTNPGLSYFAQTPAADAMTTNACSGWDPNNDTTSDRYNNYSLRWPTDASDPRGSLFTVGDVIPLDWTDDHNLDIQARLAPNLTTDPFGVPDFRISAYLRNLPQLPDGFLRLKDESKRPLIAYGSTPLGSSMRSFRTWYSGCPSGFCPPTAGWKGIAAANDPDWQCRRKFLVVLTDGEDTCGVDPCSVAHTLWVNEGIQTFAVGLGTATLYPNSLHCIADEGGTGQPFQPRTLAELVTALQDIFTAAKATP